MKSRTLVTLFFGLIGVGLLAVSLFLFTSRLIFLESTKEAVGTVIALSDYVLHTWASGHYV